MSPANDPDIAQQLAGLQATVDRLTTRVTVAEAFVTFTTAQLIRVLPADNKTLVADLRKSVIVSASATDPTAAAGKALEAEELAAQLLDKIEHAVRVWSKEG